MSQYGDAHCVVHVHKFSGDREQHAVRCDQGVHIVHSKHTCQRVKYYVGTYYSHQSHVLDDRLVVPLVPVLFFTSHPLL